MKTPAIDRAIEVLGGISATARKFKVTPWAVSKWRKRVPAERAIPIEEATNGLVTRHALRPDIYPREDRPRKRRKAA